MCCCSTNHSHKTTSVLQIPYTCYVITLQPYFYSPIHSHNEKLHCTSLNLSYINPWTVLKWERRKWAEPQHALLSLLPDCWCHVTSQLLLLLLCFPHDKLCPPRTVSSKKEKKKTLPSLRSFARYFVMVVRKVTVHGKSPSGPHQAHTELWLVEDMPPLAHISFPCESSGWQLHRDRGQQTQESSGLDQRASLHLHVGRRGICN